MSRFHDPSSRSLAPSSPLDGAGDMLPSPRAGAMAGDPLSDVLRTVRLSGALFFVWEVSWPYATPVPDGSMIAPIVLPGAQQIVSYHIVREGCCWGSVLGGQPVRLEAGDVLLVPRGNAYVIASSAEGCVEARLETEASLGFFRQIAAGELPLIVADGGGGDTTTKLVCGFLGCDVRPFNPALSASPPLVRLRPSPDSDGNRLHTLIDYTLAEARHPRAGGRCVVDRIGELMFVEVLRRCLAEQAAARGGWLAGLRDPVVGRALRLLHARPAAPWSLDTLAHEVGASRSRLAESFARLVGQPPMLYLTQWRLQIAAAMLVDGNAKVAAIAREVGYESEAAFSRAFKRFAGVSPQQWRREAPRRAVDQ